MERHSALADKKLAVAVEQISIFLTSDNTVVTFFEQSADDIEIPIIDRLGSRETTLRRSSDTSMVVQAIIDAIIDLAIPVTNAYRDAIDELELNVLTEPTIGTQGPSTSSPAKFPNFAQTSTQPLTSSMPSVTTAALPARILGAHSSAPLPPPTSPSHS